MRRLIQILAVGAIGATLSASSALASQLPPASPATARPASSATGSSAAAGAPAFQQGDALAVPSTPSTPQSSPSPKPEGSGGTSAGSAPPASKDESESESEAAPEVEVEPAPAEVPPTSAEPFEIPSIPSSTCASAGVPPILIPIYQRAAAAYGLGPQGPAVLAGINEIETAFGTNLNVSSAGAIGWMQFIQSSWEMYGVDANGDGVRDPYNPEDAIFAAARYLSAAGMPSDTYGAIFSYNHADWYVADVLANAACYSGINGPATTTPAGFALTPKMTELTCKPADDWRNAIPDEYMAAFESAAARYELGRRGVWALAAVARLESDFGKGMAKSQLRRSGPLGLDGIEWRTYAVDGDEDGHIRHADPADSAATLARMIWSRGSLRAGLFTHNQAEWYVQAVLEDAKQVKGSCETKTVDWAIDLPGGTGAPINWANLTLSNELELRDITGGALDPRIVALIGAITQEHEITISALRSDHSEYTTTGNVSNHYFGRAMDIASVDGVSCTDTAPDAPCADLARTLAYLPAPLHPTELIYCFDVDGPGPAFALPDHCDHVHAGYDAE